MLVMPELPSVAYSQRNALRTVRLLLILSDDDGRREILEYLTENICRHCFTAKSGDCYCRCDD